VRGKIDDVDLIRHGLQPTPVIEEQLGVKLARG
jgi:hypothetical protein